MRSFKPFYEGYRKKVIIINKTVMLLSKINSYTKRGVLETKVIYL